MNPTEPNPADSLGGTPEEERLGELINEFFDRRERGETLSEDAFLAEHPEHARQLREHLGSLELLEQLGSSTGQANYPHSPGAAAKGSSAETHLSGGPTPLPQIPGYEILKQIGRGGMGVVFKAVQISTKRVVALKLLLEGSLASEATRKRFEREISLAAQLRHSNIIPIYDSGVADGRMYYAMEHIFGLSLNDYLNQSGLDINGRLRLFEKVCHAVAHAHQRGVIHRDLKPSNILVDGQGEPHVLDFGLAKAGSVMDMTTSVTAQIIGTPAYMSPEQATGDPTGVDTRADVYSLGVILYENLTGRMPYETNIAIGKLLHNIAHAEPVPPNKIDSRIDGEVAAVVMKALEKSKESRYQSVDALSGDVGRYLAGEPVTAKRASGFYLLRKAAAKHRVGLAVCAALVVVAVVAGLIVRQFSTKLERTVEQSRQLQEQVTRKAAEVDALVKERAVAEEARANYDRALRQLQKADPEAAKVIDALSKSVAAGVSGKEKPIAIIPGLASKLISQLGGGESDSSWKEPDPPATAPLVSPRPELKSPDRKPAVSRAEFEKMMDALWRRMQEGQGPPPDESPPASQPTSAPATSSPTSRAAGNS